MQEEESKQMKNLENPQKSQNNTTLMKLLCLLKKQDIV